MTLDEKEVVFQRGQPTNLKISGEIEDYNRGGRIYMSVTDPQGITSEHKLIGTKDGYYENHLWFDSRTSDIGEYNVQIKYLEEISSNLSFTVGRPQMVESTELQFMEIQHKVTPMRIGGGGSGSDEIPLWIKSNARWWAEGTIDDTSFINGIQYLIKNNIISIDNLSETSATSESKIPDWIKNNAKWWADGTIEDSSFVQSIQYLVENGIIEIDD